LSNARGARSLPLLRWAAVLAALAVAAIKEKA